jgi:ribosomal-protein-alanine N-acetyltransferase
MVILSGGTLRALLDGDRARASAEAGVELSDYFVTDRARRLWQRRLAQLAMNPDSQEWIARAVVDETQDVVVGYAGYHGPPDDDGMVEIGYSVDVGYRRKGYARAMIRELLRRANTDPRVKTVRATISPNNVASLATIQGFGFAQTGQQWDEEDGLELVFEIPVGASLSER